MEYVIETQVVDILCFQQKALTFPEWSGLFRRQVTAKAVWLKVCLSVILCNLYVYFKQMLQMTCYYLTIQNLRDSVYTAYFSLISFKL